MGLAATILDSSAALDPHISCLQGNSSWTSHNKPKLTQPAHDQCLPHKLLLLRPVSEGTPLSPQIMGILLGSPAPLAPICNEIPRLLPDYSHSSDHTAKPALFLIWPLPTPLATISRESSVEPQN